MLARFEQERQALALMEHPNIARVLDGGLTPNGQPFFVMELVNCARLEKFCEGAKTLAAATSGAVRSNLPDSSAHALSIGTLSQAKS